MLIAKEGLGRAVCICATELFGATHPLLTTL